MLLPRRACVTPPRIHSLSVHPLASAVHSPRPDINEIRVIRGSLPLPPPPPHIPDTSPVSPERHTRNSHTAGIPGPASSSAPSPPAAHTTPAISTTTPSKTTTVPPIRDQRSCGSRTVNSAAGPALFPSSHIEIPETSTSPA